ncbi:MAG: prepilin-type N-terminal cleavage/methylation domain-containing protein, partial [Lachnospiraceae bacterium]|nr:prepilin-type N-terminal cleavage/methylation domain-containing protein [Lachnospiraceae bacterium]
MKERKGFTMAELLIVVAIIAVLVAIAIPIFT